MYRIVRWRDLLSFGLPAAALTAIALLAGRQQANAGKPIWIAWAAAGGAWAFLAGLVSLRAAFRARVVYTTRHGIMVARGGPAQTEVEAETDRIVRLWKGSAGIDVARHLEGLFLVWRPLPFEGGHGTVGLVSGLFYPRTRTLHVGIGDGLPVRSTSLGHELGHAIWWAESHGRDYHVFAQSKGLP
jgi:hypothetical protein